MLTKTVIGMKFSAHDACSKEPARFASRLKNKLTVEHNSEMASF